MIIAGVDEAGRGPLAGPVIAAAVIIPEKVTFSGLKDSKKLTEKARTRLFLEISELAIVSVGRGEVAEIDKHNILQATFIAMQRAVAGLKQKIDLVQIDGNMAPYLPYKTETIVKGDDKIIQIAAASVIAKVTRDNEMQKLALQYPEYGFEQHKGYGTKKHLEAIKLHGPCPIHRRSFAPTLMQETVT